MYLFCVELLKLDFFTLRSNIRGIKSIYYMTYLTDIFDQRSETSSHKDQKVGSENLLKSSGHCPGFLIFYILLMKAELFPEISIVVLLSIRIFFNSISNIMQKYWTILHIRLIIYCFSRQRPLISQQCGSSPDPADVPFLIERLNGLKPRSDRKYLSCLTEGVSQN